MSDLSPKDSSDDKNCSIFISKLWAITSVASSSKLRGSDLNSLLLEHDRNFKAKLCQIKWITNRYPVSGQKISFRVTFLVESNVDSWAEFSILLIMNGHFQWLMDETGQSKNWIEGWKKLDDHAGQPLKIRLPAQLRTTHIQMAHFLSRD